jgi:hypothetical protein
MVRDDLTRVNYNMVNKINAIDSGDADAYGMGMSHNKIKRGGTREKEFLGSAMMELPTNTNLPRGVESTRNSKLYLPIKQSGAYQTPNQVLQFYHNGGIQGAGAGQADYMNVEKVGGRRRGGVESDAMAKLVPVVSLLSGKNKVATKRLLLKAKDNMDSRGLKLSGSGMLDDMFNTIKKEAPSFLMNNLPDIIKHGTSIYKAIKGGKMTEEDEDNMADDMVENYIGGGFFDDLWDGVKSIGSTALSVLPHALPLLMGLGKVKGGVNIPAPLGVSQKYEDLRGTRREGAGGLGDIFPVLGMLGLGKKKGGNKLGEDMAGVQRNVGSGGMTKAQKRGQIIKRIMKENGCTLGEASKFLSQQTKK